MATNRVLGLYAEDYPWDVRVEKIMHGFGAAGFEPHLLCRNEKRSPLTETVGPITCHRVLGPAQGGPLRSLTSTPAPFNPLWRRRLDALVRELDPAFLVVRDVPMAVTAIRAAHRRGIPAVVDMAENHPAMWANVIRTDPFPPRSWIMKNPAVARRLERTVAAEADLVFVVVEEMREHLLQVGCAPERLAIVSNTPPVAILANEADARTGGEALEVIFVGNITGSRGLQDVVAAVGGVGPDEPPMRFHVVGKGPYLAALQAQAAALGADERVVFHGWVASDRVPQLLARCNVGIIPHQRTEHTDTTIPNKIFDYMAVGLPAVVSDAVPLRRLVESEDCGRAYVSGDADGLREVLRALRDPETRQRLGANGRAAVTRRYHWEHDLGRATTAVRAVLDAWPMRQEPRLA